MDMVNKIFHRTISSFVILRLFFPIYTSAVVPPAVEKAKAGIVKIESPLGKGTGFFIRHDVIATNFHVVVSETGLIPIEDINITQVGHQKENISVRVVNWLALSPLNDLVIIKVSGHDGFILPVEEDLIPENEVYVLGFPGNSKSLQEIVGSDGVQSRDQIYEFFTNFSNSAGSSGSPVLNPNAQLLGIISNGQHNFLRAEKAIHIKTLLEESGIPEELDETEEPNMRGQRMFHQSMEHIQHLAEENHTKAIYQIGNFHKLGVGFTRNIEMAMNFFIRAATQGHNEAQNEIGSIYLDKNDYKRALVWFRGLIDQHHPIALLNLGRMLLSNKPQSNNRDAMKILKIAAVQGAVHAQHLLALMHEKQGNYTKATFLV